LPAAVAGVGDSAERVLDAFEAPDAEPAREGEAPPGLAAVLLALYDTPRGPALLYTRRTDTLRSHAGQISFPGGRVEKGEAPRDAALREAQEEVGLRDVRGVRHLTDYATFRGTTVIAYVGLASGPPPREPVSRDEVAEVFLVAVRDLLDPATYEARAMAGPPPPGLRERVVHYWRVEAVAEHGAEAAPDASSRRVVWGITGELTARFLAGAFRWSPPPRVRTVARPEEFDPRTLP
jgi:8-oxo-dGTP pyrophosphatase MutT (NUDIX family)